MRLRICSADLGTWLERSLVEQLRGSGRNVHGEVSSKNAGKCDSAHVFRDSEEPHPGENGQARIVLSAVRLRLLLPVLRRVDRLIHPHTRLSASCNVHADQSRPLRVECIFQNGFEFCGLVHFLCGHSIALRNFHYIDAG
jgi:hypothetical protein